MTAGFTQKNGMLHADGLSVADIANGIETPFYLYSGDKIRERYTALSTAVTSAWKGTNKPWIAFACKSNSNLAIMHLLGTLGAGMDVVSGGELTRALTAKIPAHKIVFSGVGKTDQELALAVTEEIHQINIESIAELDVLEQICENLGKGVSIALRFTPEVDSKAHEKTSTGEEDQKFGLMRDEITEIAKRLKGHKHITLKGVSMHIGSGVPSLDPFREAFERTAELVTELRNQHGATITHVDLGGGLWIPYRNEPQADLNAYGKMIADIFEPLDVQVVLEPGRILVAESGAVISRVIFIKKRPSKTFAIIDAAMNDLIRPTLYDAHHQIVAVEEKGAAKTVYDIVGPVCETGDYLALDRDMPELKRGDAIAILCAGAYGTAMGSNYNTRPLIPEVMVDQGRVRIIRTRQHLADLWKDEIL